MKIADLPLPKKIVKALLASEPFDTLNPPQEAVVEAGLFTRKNFLIAIPTASGKTFIAELSALQHVVEFHKKVIYLTPLKALAQEKYHDFKRFSSLGIKVGITVSDFDSADSHLFEKYDIIVSTNEKIDSLLRHNKSFMQQDISLLIIDECHLIDDSSRGPTLETLIVKIKHINPTIQLLALSATVHNSDELANWLNAILVESNWRSVPVEEYFCSQDGIIHHRSSQETRHIDDKLILESLVSETLRDNGQVLVFANENWNAVSTAFALDLGLMYLILAFFFNTLANGEKKLVPNDLLKKFRASRNKMLIASTLFFISMAPIFYLTLAFSFPVEGGNKNMPVRGALWISVLFLNLLMRGAENLWSRIKNIGLTEFDPAHNYLLFFRSVWLS